MELEAAVRRAQETGLECRAEFRYRHRGTDAWVQGLVCNLSPGHEGAHGEYMGDYGDYAGQFNVSFGSVHPGGHDTERWTDDEDGCLPSPWTAAELAAWHKVAPSPSRAAAIDTMPRHTP